MKIKAKKAKVKSALKKKKVGPPKSSTTSPSHPWRLCPAGKHWVSEHPRKVAPSLLNPLGTTEVEGHCAWNPSHRDQLYPDEIQEIASRKFDSLILRPNSNPLGFKQGSEYDHLIAGWTQYWNEVLKPREILEPNTVKALIASESGFRSSATARAGKNDFARGLTQITDRTRVILSDEKGELEDHFVNVTEAEAYDPNLNICAGIRWLFRKREIAEARFGNEISWDKVIFLYKAAHKNPKLMDKFRKYSDRLRRQKAAPI